MSTALNSAGSSSADSSPTASSSTDPKSTAGGIEPAGAAGPISRLGKPVAWLALWAVVMLYALGVMLWGWWVYTHTDSSSVQLPPGQAATTSGGSTWQVVKIARVTQPPEGYEPVPGTELVSAELSVTRAGEELCTPSLVGRDGRLWEELMDYSMDVPHGCGELPSGVKTSITWYFQVPQSEVDQLYGVKWSPMVEVGRQQVLRPAS